MKSLLLIGFLIATVLGDQQQPTYEQMLVVRQKCFDEIPVPEQNRETIMKYEFPDEEIYHKYVRCLSLNVGNWDDVNGYNTEVMKVVIRKYLEIAIFSGIDDCVDNNEAKKSTEKWAYDNFMCMENNVFKHARKIVHNKN